MLIKLAGQVVYQGQRLSAAEIEEKYGARAIAEHETADFDELRSKRNVLLRACDWTQVPDAALTSEQKAKWTAYRTALRDLPESVADLDKVEWPVAPA